MPGIRVTQIWVVVHVHCRCPGVDVDEGRCQGDERHGGILVVRGSFQRKMS